MAFSTATMACRLSTRSGRLSRYANMRRGLAHNPLNRPAPPPLPAKDQLEFEALVRAAAAPLSSQTQKEALQSDAEDAHKDQQQTKEVLQAEVARIAKGEELHPHARRAPAPDFEGDTNPRTGEVGGPKHEPLRHGDWSYGGRISDF